MHQHLDIGQGEVDFDQFFRGLERIGFDGIVTSCVFAWEERARESTTYMRDSIRSYLDKWSTPPTLVAPLRRPQADLASAH